MPDIQQTASQSNKPEKTDQDSPHTAIAPYQKLPIGLRRVANGTIAAATILIAVTFLHPNLQKAVFLTGSLLDLFVIVAVIVQAYIYNGQWQVMQEQERITTLTERAYLGVRDVKLINPIVDNTLVIYAIVFNGGRTPALAVDRKLKIAMLPEPTPFDWDKCLEQAEFSVIPAGVPRRFNFPYLKFTKAEFTEFDAGDREIHLDGEFRFTDFMGVKQIFAFGMSCRARDNGDFYERYQRQYEADPD